LIEICCCDFLVSLQKITRAVLHAHAVDISATYVSVVWPCRTTVLSPPSRHVEYMWLQEIEAGTIRIELSLIPRILLKFI
jgi:hypothetical protein